MTPLRGVILIAMQIQTTLRHVIGVGLRRIADILLSDFPEGVKEPTKEEAFPAEPPRKQKPRDRSSYDPTLHKTFYHASVGILRDMLNNPTETRTVKQLEGTVDCSQSSIRSTCKKLVELGVLLGEGYPAVYRLADPAVAVVRLAEYEKQAGPVPVASGEVREPDPSLDQGTA